MSIQQYAQNLMAHPANFRRELRVDADGVTRRLDDILDPWQLADFEALDDSLIRVVKGDACDGDACLRHWWERGRGHSKTSDIATAVSWLLLASRRPLRGIACAADEDQARLIQQAIRRLADLNPILDKLFKITATKVENVETGSTLEIITSDAPSSYGLLIDFAICDEVTHWQKRDLFDSMLSAAAKKKHCLLLAITNAGHFGTWQHELRERIRTDEAWRFSRLEGPQASWISAEHLREQERLLPPQVYRRLWLNEWLENEGDGFDADDLEACFKSFRPPSEPERGYEYVIGVDIGLTHDASAVCVLGKHVGYQERIQEPRRRYPSAIRAAQDLGMFDDVEPARPSLLASPYESADGQPTKFRTVAGTGVMKLCAMKTWKPTDAGPVKLGHVEHELIRLHERYRPSIIACDPWQAVHLIERLQLRGLACEPVNFTGRALQSMATCVLDAVRQRRLELFLHEQLRRDLERCRLVERSYGFRLEFARDASGHGDCGTALMLAIHACRKLRTALTVNRQLVLSY